MKFPEVRMRRRRKDEATRRRFRETELRVSQLVMPYFVVPGEAVRRPIGSLPGQYHLSVDELVKEAAELTRLGVVALLLFGQLLVIRSKQNAPRFFASALWLRWRAYWTLLALR